MYMQKILNNKYTSIIIRIIIEKENSSKKHKKNYVRFARIREKVTLV